MSYQQDNKIYSGYYYRGYIFPGESALPFNIPSVGEMLAKDDQDGRLPYNIKIAPIFKGIRFFDGKKQEGVIHFRQELLGEVWDDENELEGFYLAYPVPPFYRLK